MRGLSVGVFTRAVRCALSICLVTGPVFANATPAFASSGSETPEVTQPAAPQAAEEASATIVSEDESKRTENSKHFLMSDGTYQAEVYEKPIFFMGEDEEWEEIDPTLVPAPEPGQYQTSAVAAPVTFATQGDAPEPVTIEGDGWSIGLDMLGTSETARLTFGRRARYLGVATDTDLEYETTDSGIKETLILDSADAPSTYSFYTSLDGLELRQTTDGSQLLYDTEGELVGELGRLVVFDSSMNEAGEPEYCSDATMTIAPVDGGAYFTYDVSRDWLEDSARVWPVKVDPTITIYDISQKPCDDTYVSSAYPTTQYSTSQELRAGYYDSTTGQNRSLVKFNLSSIPTYARIDSAEFKVFQFHTYYTNTATTTYFARPTSYWSHTYTWNNKPSYTYLGQQSVTGRNVWVSQGCGQTVQNWIDGTWYNYGFMIYQSENGSQNTTHWRKFRSGEYGTTAYRPRLVVNYTTIPDTVTGVSGTTSALDWFVEGGTARPNNFPNVGRGEAALSWSPSARAEGYKIMMYDGINYQQVGKVFGKSTTSWSSRDAGIWPTDSQIAAFGAPNTYTGNALTRAATPRAATQNDSFNVSGQSGAGVIVTDGTYLYTRRWGGSSYGGSTTWRRIGSGYNGTTKGVDYGGVGPSFASKDIYSAFHLDGFIYNGYIDWVGGKAGVAGVWRDAEEGSTETKRLEFSAPPLDRATCAPVTGSTSNVMLTADEDHIYSMAYDSSGGYRYWKIRVYNHDGTFVADKTVNTPSYYTDGVFSDGQALYMVEWAPSTDSARMTKVGLSDFKVVNQWPINQATTRAINGCYDEVNKVFWMGKLDGTGTIYRYLGSGLDLRDNPNDMYLQMKDSAYDTATKYWFRVIAFNEDAEDAAQSGAWMPTLDNRSVNVNDDPRHTTHDLGEMAGHSAAAQLDSGALVMDTTDLSIATYGPEAALSRHYDSAVVSTGAWAPGWRFNFEQSLSVAGSVATYVDEAGDSHVFKSEYGQWHAPNGMVATLSAITGGYRLQFKDESYLVFSSSGELTAEGDHNGNETTYSRTTDALSIQAESGQSIEVALDGDRILSAVYGTADGTRTVDYDSGSGYMGGSSASVEYFAGTDDAYTVDYAYDASNRLIGLAVSPFTQPDGSDPEWEFNYDEDPGQDPDGFIHEVHYPGYESDAYKRADISYGGRQATITRYGDVDVFADRAISQTYQWNPTGTLWTSTDPMAPGDPTATWTYAYSPTNQAVTELSPTGKSIGRTLDVRDNTLYEVDEEGNRTAYIYDDRDRVIRQTDPRGGATYFTYDSDSNLLSEEKVLNAEGERSRTSYSYNTSGLQTEERVLIQAAEPTPIEAVTEYGPFALNGEPTVTKQFGVVLKYLGTPATLQTEREYDAFGNLLSETDALGVVAATNEYSAETAMRLLESVDASGAVSHTRYDALGNQVETWRTAPGSSDKADWALTKVDIEGKTTETSSKLASGVEIGRATYAFDAAGRGIGSDDVWVVGSSVTHLDARGNAIKEWAEAEESTLADPIAASRSTYDEYGQLVASYASGETSATVHEYNADGTVSKQINPDGSFTTYGYDKANNRVSETDQDGAMTTYTCDLGGRVVLSVSPEEVSTTHEYDLAGREVSTGGGNEEQASTTTAFNSLGWMLRVVDADGIATTKEYDKAGRVALEDVGGKATRSDYDGRGMLTLQIDPDGKNLQTTYDALGRAERELQTTEQGVVKDTAATYDSAGRALDTLDARSGVERTYLYATSPASGSLLRTDYAGQSTTLSIDPKAEETSRVSLIKGIAAPVVRSVTLRDSSRRETVWSVGGLAFSREYRETDGRITRITVDGSEFGYDYDAAGRKQRDTGSLPFAGSLEARYTYSETGRLSSSKRAQEATRTYTFDAAGNLTNETVGVDTRLYAYDKANSRLSNVTAGGVVESVYGWNELGQRVSQGPANNPLAEQFWYTGTGRVAKYVSASVVASYTYDATGQRLTSSVESDETTLTDIRYTYEGLSLLSLSATTTVDGSLESTYSMDYLYDAGEAAYACAYRSSENTSPVVFYMVTTDRGDVVELREVGGDPFAAYSYDPWGVPLADPLVASAGSVAATLAATIANQQPLRYAGYAWDQESEMYYLSARTYDPATRQFITKDPAKDDGEESAYQYCGGDPVGRVDPRGLYARSFIPDVGEQTTYFIRVLKVNAGRAWSKAHDVRGFFQWFYNAVRSRGPWDLKMTVNWKYRQSQSFIMLGRRITAEQFGNIHFGYVGRAGGFSYGALAVGSYLWAAFKTKTQMDEANDRKWIKWGYDLYGQYGKSPRCNSVVNRYIYPGYSTARGFPARAR